MQVVLRDQAIADVRQISMDLDKQLHGLGDRFLKRVQETLDRIEFMPHMYGEVWRTVRAARVRKFRYVVYHIVRADHVEVIAVLHGARDPSVWQSRV